MKVRSNSQFHPSPSRKVTVSRVSIKDLRPSITVAEDATIPPADGRQSSANANDPRDRAAAAEAARLVQAFAESCAVADVILEPVGGAADLTRSRTCPAPVAHHALAWMARLPVSGHCTRAGSPTRVIPWSPERPPSGGAWGV